MPAAALVEFIHTATLLHDDVVDGSSMRRGRDTANERFGNQASVLVDDFLYSRAFQMMVTLGQMRVMSVMAGATSTPSPKAKYSPTDERATRTTGRYLEVIHRKTAKLFEAGAQVAAIVAGTGADTEARARGLRPAPRHGLPAGRRRARLFGRREPARQEPRR